MDRLDRLSSYFNEKEKKRLESKAKENNGVPEMSEDEIRLSCLQNNGYETPELNDKLYLHFRGFRRIENLDKYTGCKSIWLDSNGFDKIEGLDKLTELRCLYLSKNLIRKIEGLNALTNLTILDLSYNRISTIENLSACTSLQTVNLSYNSLSSVESIAHLQECTALTNIDLTNNRLECDEEFFSFFPKIPSLVTLSVNGNEITKLGAFRKKMVAAMPKLGYLDRPIDESEKIFAKAFVEGGQEAETKARADWKELQNQKRIQEMNDFKAWQKEQQKLREQARQEGKSLIKEFTAEEQEQRRLEAEKAAAAEREILSLGVDKVAQKYWQLEANSANQGKDILEMAVDQLHAQKNKFQQKEEVEVDDIQVDMDEQQPQQDGLSAATAITSLSPSSNKAPRKIPIEEIDDDEEEEVEPARPAEPAKPKEPTEDELREQARKEEEARQERERQLQEEKERAEREQRVAESFAIYKKQLQARQNQPEDLPQAVRDNQHRNTWHAAATSSALEDEAPRPIYWSEVMDLELAKQVKANVFDFDAISRCMMTAAKDRKLDNVIVHRNPELLTNEVCRLRWADLDASNWCVPAPGVTAQDTIFRINLTDEILQQTGGAQPSFEELANLARGSKPGYLKTPIAFPSVQDIMDELD